MNDRFNKLKILPLSQSAIPLLGRLAIAVAFFAVVTTLTGCGDSSSASEGAQVSTVSNTSGHDKSVTGSELEFSRIFAHNCAGCHGINGNDGSAPPLNNALFLSLASHDYLFNTIANGRTKHMMPSWLVSSGKTMGKGNKLSKKQINQVIRGLHEKWGGDVKDASDAPQLALHKTSSGKLTGDAKEGKKIYNQVYASMGKDVWLNQMSHSDQAWYLRITSNQLLRRLLITGRKSFNLPDYKQAGLQSTLDKPLSDEQITDVVAYLAAKRQSVAIAKNE